MISRIRRICTVCVSVVWKREHKKKNQWHSTSMKNGTENGIEKCTRRHHSPIFSGLEVSLVLGLYNNKEQIGQILEKLLLIMKLFDP